VLDPIVDKSKYDEEQITLSGILGAVIKNMPASFDLYKVIVDNDGKPVDLEYVETNRFQDENFPGGNILKGKRVTEVFPGIHDMEPDLIRTYGEVGLTGKSRDL